MSVERTEIFCFKIKTCWCGSGPWWICVSKKRLISWEFHYTEWCKKKQTNKKASVLWMETFPWWERSEMNDQTRWSWQKGWSYMNSHSLPLFRGEQKSISDQSGGRDGLQQDHIGFHYCLSKAGIRGYTGHRLTKHCIKHYQHIVKIHTTNDWEFKSGVYWGNFSLPTCCSCKIEIYLVSLSHCLLP